VCLSVPAIVTREGVERIVEGDLSGGELEALSRSASVLQAALSGLGGEG
jgi:malate/lactate dehydrogenase